MYSINCVATSVIFNINHTQIYDSTKRVADVISVCRGFDCREYNSFVPGAFSCAVPTRYDRICDGEEN